LKREWHVYPPEEHEHYIKRKTEDAQRLAEHMSRNVRDYDTDASYDNRIKLKQCKACFYFKRPALAQQAITQFNCELCGKEKWHGNSSVDRNCGEHDVCVRCSGKIEQPFITNTESSCNA
jgi:hypothetical protein